MKLLLVVSLIALLAAPVLGGPCTKGPPWCRHGWNQKTQKCEEPIVDLGPGYKPDPKRARELHEAAAYNYGTVDE